MSQIVTLSFSYVSISLNRIVVKHTFPIFTVAEDYMLYGEQD